MKPKGSSTILKCTGIILMVFLLAIVGYRSSHPAGGRTTVIHVIKAAKPAAKPTMLGAACCKASFSRAKMLSVGNSRTTSSN